MAQFEHNGKTYTLFELYQDGQPCDICAICETRTIGSIEHYKMTDYFYGVARDPEDNIATARKRLEEILGTEYYSVVLETIANGESVINEQAFDTLEQAVEHIYKCKTDYDYLKRSLGNPNGDWHEVEVNVGHSYIDDDGEQQFDEILGLRDKFLASEKKECYIVKIEVHADDGSADDTWAFETLQEAKDFIKNSKEDKAFLKDFLGDEYTPDDEIFFDIAHSYGDNFDILEDLYESHKVSELI